MCQTPSIKTRAEKRTNRQKDKRTDARNRIWHFSLKMCHLVILVAIF